MYFESPLQEAILIRRYKRFLADIELSDGSTRTIHCPNTGSMKNCQSKGSRIWFTESSNRNRNYANTWQIIEVDETNLVGINTNLANKLVAEAIAGKVIEQLKHYTEVRTEVPYGNQNSRIDFLLSLDQAPHLCFVEVKNVSLALEQGVGIFPDAITIRGQKHLQELIQVQKLGHRAVLLFCVQHTGIEIVRAAGNIDPEYARLLGFAARNGVEILAYRTQFDIRDSAITISDEISVDA